MGMVENRKSAAPKEAQSEPSRQPGIAQDLLEEQFAMPLNLIDASKETAKAALLAVVADPKKEDLVVSEKAVTTFLQLVGRGFDAEGNWVLDATHLAEFDKVLDATKAAAKALLIAAGETPITKTQMDRAAAMVKRFRDLTKRRAAARSFA